MQNDSLESFQSYLFVLFSVCCCAFCMCVGSFIWFFHFLASSILEQGVKSKRWERQKALFCFMLAKVLVIWPMSFVCVLCLSCCFVGLLIVGLVGLVGCWFVCWLVWGIFCFRRGGYCIFLYFNQNYVLCRTTRHSCCKTPLFMYIYFLYFNFFVKTTSQHVDTVLFIV